MEGFFSKLGALGVAVAVGCNGGSSIGTLRQIDDASTIPEASTGGAANTSDAPGGGSATAGSGGSTPDAGLCSGSSITHVVRTPTTYPPRSNGTGGVSTDGSAGTGGNSGTGGTDGGPRLPGLPINPCGGPAPPDCSPVPRPVFDCPVVRGPDDTSRVAPGDAITVTVPIFDDMLDAYSCTGIEADHALIGASVLSYAVKPGYVRISGQIPPTTAHGTVIHFDSIASGARYSSGAPCSSDLTRIDFDVTVD